MPRTTFTDAEIAYLQSERLARVATVDESGNPRIVATGFSFNADKSRIELSGIDVAKTRRWRDLQRNPHIAFLVDDVPDPAHWNPRNLTVRGTAVLHDAGDQSDQPSFETDKAWMHIEPESIRSWGLDDA